MVHASSGALAEDDNDAKEEDQQEGEVEDKDEVRREKLLAWLRMLIGACMRLF